MFAVDRFVLAPARVELSPNVTDTVLVKAPTPLPVENVSAALLEEPVARPLTLPRERLALVEAEMVWRATRKPDALLMPIWDVCVLVYPACTLWRETALVESAPAAWL